MWPENKWYLRSEKHKIQVLSFPKLMEALQLKR